MIVIIKRMQMIENNESSFMNILETLNNNKEKRSEKILGLERDGFYKNYISFSGKNHFLILRKIRTLIKKRVLLEGDIVITNNNDYINYFSVIRGNIVNSI